MLSKKNDFSPLRVVMVLVLCLLTASDPNEPGLRCRDEPCGAQHGYTHPCAAGLICKEHNEWYASCLEDPQYVPSEDNTNLPEGCIATVTGYGCALDSDCCNPTAFCDRVNRVCVNQCPGITPTQSPTFEPTPTSEPTEPTFKPTGPTETPTTEPTAPTEEPTFQPTNPTEAPTAKPTEEDCKCIYQECDTVGFSTCCHGLTCQPYSPGGNYGTCVEEAKYRSLPEPRTCLLSRTETGCQTNSDCCNEFAYCDLNDNVCHEFCPATNPTMYPTSNPTIPTSIPSGAPSKTPSSVPTSIPSTVPLAKPSPSPSSLPTSSPSKPPLSAPSSTPTKVPLAAPTPIPTSEPTDDPTEIPTEEPSTAEPTADPTFSPTAIPTKNPTTTPTTTSPTAQPSTETPTANPTATPTAEPTAEPTIVLSATNSFEAEFNILLVNSTVNKLDEPHQQAIKSVVAKILNIQLHNIDVHVSNELRKRLQGFFTVVVTMKATIPNSVLPSSVDTNDAGVRDQWVVDTIQEAITSGSATAEYRKILKNPNVSLVGIESTYEPPTNVKTNTNTESSSSQQEMPTIEIAASTGGIFCIALIVAYVYFRQQRASKLSKDAENNNVNIEDMYGGSLEPHISQLQLNASQHVSLNSSNSTDVSGNSDDHAAWFSLEGFATQFATSDQNPNFENPMNIASATGDIVEATSSDSDRKCDITFGDLYEAQGTKSIDMAEPLSTMRSQSYGGTPKNQVVDDEGDNNAYATHNLYEASPDAIPEAPTTPGERITARSQPFKQIQSTFEFISQKSASKQNLSEKSPNPRNSGSIDKESAAEVSSKKGRSSTLSNDDEGAEGHTISPLSSNEEPPVESTSNSFDIF